MTLRSPVVLDTEVIVTGVPQSKRRRQLRRTAESYAFLSPTIILVFVLMIIPIVMVIGYSLQDKAIIGKNHKFVGLDNYVSVLTNPNFWNATSNTVIFTVVSVVAHLIIGLGFALMLNSTLIGAVPRAIFRGLYVLPWLFTVAVIAVLWRMLLAGLQGIPSDLYEAATVDGAGPVQRFWNVTLPQLRPIMVSLVLLDLIWTSQQFALIWMTTGGGPINVTEVLSTFTYKLAFAKYDFSQAATSAVLVLLMSMVLAVFYVRHQKARD